MVRALPADSSEHRIAMGSHIGDTLEDVPVLHDLAAVVQPEDIGFRRRRRVRWNRWFGGFLTRQPPSFAMPTSDAIDES